MGLLLDAVCGAGLQVAALGAQPLLAEHTFSLICCSTHKQQRHRCSQPASGSPLNPITWSPATNHGTAYLYGALSLLTKLAYVPSCNATHNLGEGQAAAVPTLAHTP